MSQLTERAEKKIALLKDEGQGKTHKQVSTLWLFLHARLWPTLFRLWFHDMRRQRLSRSAKKPIPFFHSRLHKLPSRKGANGK